MNQLELTLLEKDKQIKEQEFYLKKQWEEFEEAKKNMNTPQTSVIPTRDFKKSGSFSSYSDNSEKQETSSKYERN